MTREKTGDATPFHAGELAVQERTGLRERAKLLGNMFQSEMPDVHRAFFARLPFALFGSVDDTGQPWASMLFGEPGFIASPDPSTLVVRAMPAPADPLSRALQPGAALGVLGIQLETRRRNRANGHVTQVTAEGFALHVDQSFGNCPKYIHVRRPEPLEAVRPPPASEPEASQLSEAAAERILASDTCFIASASAAAPALATARDVDSREGVDISHRGGKPGFVQVERTSRGTRLLMPDYVGNNAFNTLGNLVRHPRAGLLFPDFERGDLLLLACDAEIVWQGHEVARFEGAQRLVTFTVQRGLWLRRAMPFRWSQAR